MKQILTLFCYCFTLAAAAQTATDSLKKRYNTQLMYRMGSSIMVGKEKRNITALKDQFTMSPDGLAMYGKAMRQYKTGRLLAWGSLGFSVAALATLDRNVNTSYLLFGGQLVTAAIGGFIRNGAQKLFDEAVWRRNKDLLFGPVF